ncbi:MAG TPA: ABC transporter permease [Polyangiaceae bacterium]|jgi:ABC-type nitrate/sulfonate/bicarbonate transport system permease component|nr:ABC transporter permease [Burkholderiales bacterium]
MTSVQAGATRHLLSTTLGVIRQYYSVLLFLVAWELIARIIGNRVFLPTLTSVLGLLAEQVASGDLLKHTAVSTYRALSGFVLSALIGVPLGIAMGWYRSWDSFWSPLVSLSYPVPKIGLIPLLILWLGIGETSKIAMILAAAIYPVILSTYSGVKGTPTYLVWSARSLGASEAEVLRKIVFPYALPHILTGLRLAMGISWILLFAAEMVAAESGLGWLILFAERMLDTPMVFAALLTIAVLGFFFDRVMLVAGQRLCNWYMERTV